MGDKVYSQKENSLNQKLKVPNNKLSDIKIVFFTKTITE